ncbi:MFS general substrate transporter [Mycena metata]|uniref:MFS general substrate transporter n=1 Tax=Mycena metata TaxID=1033252 RepID=A0AAD7KC82_9AGAR|nr:MFS general substrate transporter [Mycena metata]
MASEDTPLFVSDAELAHEAVYKRFPTPRKRVIVALVSFQRDSALVRSPAVACWDLISTGIVFASGTFIPSIPDIARDLNSTADVVSFAVSLSICGAGLGSMVFATYAGFCKFKCFTVVDPMYLYGLPLLCLGSIGVGLSKTIPQLMVFRFIQAFGTSGGFAVGGGVIGDIYKLTERGTCHGCFLRGYIQASLVGNAISPVVGAKYSSWRNVQLGLFFVGLAVFLAMLIFLPETSHPGTLGREKNEAADSENQSSRKFKWVWLNPFACLWLLRSPNLLFVTITGATVLCTDYALLVPIAYTLGARYNISNEAIIGSLFLPLGLGNIIGAPVAGILSDRMVIKWRKLRGGEWVPEDRLRATLWPGATIVPLSVVFCGLITTYIPGPLGLTLNLISFFFNGIGVDLVLSPCSAYSVDIMHSRSAEMLAANTGLRSFLVSVAISGVMPSLNYFGLVATYSFAGILAWFGFILLWVTVRYGDKLRAWVDVGYSTIETT